MSRLMRYLLVEVGKRANSPRSAGYPDSKEETVLEKQVAVSKRKIGQKVYFRNLIERS